MLLKFTKMFKTKTNTNWLKTQLVVPFMLLMGLMLVSNTSYSQVKIGGDPDSIDDGSILEIESTTGAFIPPRMNTAQRDALPTPLRGAIIFNTDTNCLEVNKGSDTDACLLYTSPSPRDRG